ncbi:hypothetical protein Efla_000247 [Eimeria flavescens]
MGFSLQSFVGCNMEGKFPNRRHTHAPLVQVLLQSLVAGRPEVYLRQAFAKLPQLKLTAGQLHMHLSGACTIYCGLSTRLRVEPGFGPEALLAKFVEHLQPHIPYENLNQIPSATSLRLPASPRNARLCGAPTRSRPRALAPHRAHRPLARTRRRSRPRARRWGTHSIAPLYPPRTPICPARRDIYISTSHAASSTTVTATAHARATPRTPRSLLALTTSGRSSTLDANTPALNALAHSTPCQRSSRPPPPRTHRRTPRRMPTAQACRSPRRPPLLPRERIISLREPGFFCAALKHRAQHCPAFRMACQQNPALAQNCPACSGPTTTGSHSPLTPATHDPTPTTPCSAIPPLAENTEAASCLESACLQVRPPSMRASCLLACASRLSMVPMHAANTRAMTVIDGTRCEVIIDTGADLSLVPAALLSPSRWYRPCLPSDGEVQGVGGQTPSILGRNALSEAVGPLETTAPFVVVVCVNFDALVGVDFLNAHEIAVSLAQHALIFEGHGGLAVPLIGHHPRLAHTCTVANTVTPQPRARTWFAMTLTLPRVKDVPHADLPQPFAYWVSSFADAALRLRVQKQQSSGLTALDYFGKRHVHLWARWPLASPQPVAPAAGHF